MRGGNIMQTVLIIIHIILSLALIIAVLMQHGKQQGLSGAIAGGAETFFGKNKGRTIDAMLRKLTSVLAALFIISSIALAVVSVNEHKSANTETVQQEAEGQVETSVDADGNIVDKDGNILISAEQLKEAEAQAENTENTDAE